MDVDIGQRLKQARLEAGLSQRQLCEGIVTRNMLSQIENGAARPSMDTLRQFALRLGKSLGYFLEEEAVTSPNQNAMNAARRAFAAGDISGALGALEGYRGPDPVFDMEQKLLLALCRMALAWEVLEEGRVPYARTLLEQAAEAGAGTAYFTPALERERRLLLAQTGDLPELPADDRELLLRARWAAERADHPGCLRLLDAAGDQTAPLWHLLRGDALFALGNYEAATVHYLAAEETYPARVVPRLEVCYREQRNFEKAYAYACKRRGGD
jgi:transcriptional regulator with XRE-family HTH domain